MFVKLILECIYKKMSFRGESESCTSSNCFHSEPTDSDWLQTANGATIMPRYRTLNVRADAFKAKLLFGQPSRRQPTTRTTITYTQAKHDRQSLMPGQSSTRWRREASHLLRPQECNTARTKERKEKLGKGKKAGIKLENVNCRRRRRRRRRLRRCLRQCNLCKFIGKCLAIFLPFFLFL